MHVKATMRQGRAAVSFEALAAVFRAKARNLRNHQTRQRLAGAFADYLA